jgi:hypothetical protein
LSLKVCRIRKKGVEETAEEGVRQHVLNHLIDDLGYPACLISVEKELKSFHVQAPKRRLDILVFKNIEGDLKPFLLIECKAVALTSRVENQVLGYNHFVRAPFVAVVNESEARFGEFIEGRWVFSPGFPLY